MRRRKSKTTIVVVRKASPEIDYDKLANTIVKAQVEAKQQKVKEEQHSSRFRNAGIGLFNSIVYFVIAAVFLLLTIGIWVTFSQGSGYSLLLSIIATVLFLPVAGFSVFCGIESWRDDFKTSVSMFNTTIALVALIIAMIALLKA